MIRFKIEKLQGMSFALIQEFPEFREYVSEYVSLERAFKLACATIRQNEKIVGFSMFHFDKGIATKLVTDIKPELKSAHYEMNLYTEIERFLINKGIHTIFFHCSPEEEEKDRLLHRMGYNLTEKVFIKTLKENENV